MFGLGEAQCLLSEPPNGAGRQGVGRSWPDSGMTAVATVVGRSYPSFPFNLLSSRHIGEPLREEGWWLINRLTEKFEPRAAGLGLEGETPSTPLGCSPDEGEGSGADEEHLAPEDLGRVHGDLRSGSLPMPTAIAEKSRLASGILWRADGTGSLSLSRPRFVIQGRGGDARI